MEKAKAGRLIDKPDCLDFRIFHYRLVGIEMRKVMLLLNKPSFLRFTVLAFA